MERGRGWGAVPRHQKNCLPQDHAGARGRPAPLPPPLAAPLVPGCAFPGSRPSSPLRPPLSSVPRAVWSTGRRPFISLFLDGDHSSPFFFIAIFPGCNRPSFARLPLHLPLHAIILQLSVLTVAPPTGTWEVRRHTIPTSTAVVPVVGRERRRRVQAGAREGGGLALGSAVSATATARSGVRWARRGRAGEGLLPWFWATCRTFVLLRLDRRSAGSRGSTTRSTGHASRSGRTTPAFSAARAGANLPAPRVPPPPPGPGTRWPLRTCYRRGRPADAASASATAEAEDEVGAPPAVVGQAPRTFDPPISHRCRSSFLSFAYKDADWYSRSLHPGYTSIRAHELDRTISAREWVAAHGGLGRLMTHSVGGSLLHQSPSPQKWCSLHMSFTPNHMFYKNLSKVFTLEQLLATWHDQHVHTDVEGCYGSWLGFLRCPWFLAGDVSDGFVERFGS